MEYHERLGIPREKFEDHRDRFEERTYEGLSYRNLPDYRGPMERGTVLVEDPETVVAGFPKVPRTLVVREGIPQHFESEVVVEEKLDGYNVRVASLDGEVYAFTRSGIVCPFTTWKVREELELAPFFDAHPDLLVCGEMVGPENPYTVHDYPGVDSLEFRAFDLRDRESGDPLPVDRRRALCEEFGIEQVGLYGRYDVETATKYDYSAPGGKTSTWEAISLTGNRDEETIYVANGSGEILIGTHDSKGCVSWKTNGSLNVAKPGGGSRTPAIDFREDGVSTGHVVDTSSQTYVTNDSGGSWENVGIPDSQVGLYDVISYKTSSGLERVYVAGGGGKLYRLDCNCQNWTPIQIGSKALRCITRDGTDRLVTGASGNIFENVGDGWTPKESPIGAMLYEATYGNSTYPDVIVGSSGNILER
jgi:hypothetical protein